MGEPVGRKTKLFGISSKTEPSRGNKPGPLFVTVRKAAELSSLHPHTLRKMADQNQISSFTTPSGHRRFNIKDLEKYCGIANPTDIKTTNEKRNYLYARVSSRKQLGDLSRQIDYLRSRNKKYATYTVVKDCASGINFKRAGLLTILDSCVLRNIGDVVVAHKDRLSRFGFDLIKVFIEKCGGKLIVTDKAENKSSEQELADDLLTIVHIFSCRQMGKRRYVRKGTTETKDAEGAKNNDEVAASENTSN